MNKIGVNYAKQMIAYCYAGKIEAAAEDLYDIVNLVNNTDQYSKLKEGGKYVKY